MNTLEIVKAVSPLQGIMPGGQKAQLIEAVKLAGPGIKLEIGCLCGLSTACIALASDNKDKIISVDPFRIEFLSGMAKGVVKNVSGEQALKKESFYDSWVKQTNLVCKGKNLVPIIGDRLEMLDIVKNNLNGEKIAMLFLDGLHSYEAVTAELEAYLPLVKKDGVVVFHDYSDTFGVKQAVDEALAKNLIKVVKKSYVFVARKA